MYMNSQKLRIDIVGSSYTTSSGVPALKYIGALKDGTDGACFVSSDRVHVFHA